jgi:hypothetical protein
MQEFPNIGTLKVNIHTFSILKGNIRSVTYCSFVIRQHGIDPLRAIRTRTHTYQTLGVELARTLTAEYTAPLYYFEHIFSYFEKN